MDVTADRAFPEYVWVVSSGHGHYAESVWTTQTAAREEADRRGYLREGEDCAVKCWKINAPKQIWCGPYEFEDDDW